MNEVIKVGRLEDPVLVAGFAVQRRAGRFSSRAVSYLLGQWDGELVAKIDPENFMNFIAQRPESRYVGDRRAIHWPETLIYRARPAGANRDFLLLVGFEPDYHWQAFIDEIVSYAEAVGVKTLVNVRGFQASIPHTRPAPVLISSSDEELEAHFGVQTRRPRYEGPTDILGVLGAAAQAKGWRTVDLTVLQPSYYPRMPNAAATMALLAVLDKAFGTTTAVDSLRIAAAQQLSTIEENMSHAEETQTVLKELERRYDDAVGKQEFLSTETSADLPSAEELVNEIERLLRRNGDG